MSDFTQLQFLTFRNQVETAFREAYILDTTTLSVEEHQAHKRVLQATQLAQVRLENAVFEQLTEQARNQLAQLRTSVAELDSALASARSSAQKVARLTSALDTLGKVAAALV
jgi:predicted DNA-binding ribbon-helix-helix protein